MLKFRWLTPSCVLCLAALLGCGDITIWKPQGIGVGGRYSDARAELRRGPRGDMKKAVANLEYVVRKDPFYHDTLSQLGRAYYYTGRYKAAFEVLKRAVAVNDQDDIAWIVLGLTQLRLGDDQQGLENFKGGLTLFIKVSKDGYRDVEQNFWDSRGVVRRTVRRSIFLSRKGLDDKQKIIRIGELLLERIDRELYQAERDQLLNEYETERN